MEEITPAQRRRLRQMQVLRNSLNDFGQQALRIKTKDSEIANFKMNMPQRYVHEKLEEQLAKTGKVRALILKGRQQGISTYVAARFYHKSSMNKARNVYILSHEQSSSDALFSIVDRYHTNNPFAPHTGVSNVKELVFDRLDSSYQVATAGQKAGGRGRMITLYHGSEVAFWQNADLHFAGSVQAVPPARNSEIILESTANGPSGEFYERWQKAQAGRGEYSAIFVPWYWSTEYSRPDLAEDFEINETAEDGELSEREYMEMFGLNLAQMAWRRDKIEELGARLFKQEYPATAEEAFQSANVDSYISSASVLRARKRENNPAGPLIFGVDPAGPGGDRFSVYARRGAGYEFLEWRDQIDAVEANLWLKHLIDEYDPAVVFIDAGGIGAATISLLRAEGPKYHEKVVAVNFASTSQHKLAKPKVPGPKNRRAEMWTRAKDALEDESIGLAIPDLDALQADLTAPALRPTSTNDILLESKDMMRSRGVRSPDLGDSFVLTYADLRHIDNYSERPTPVASEVVNPDAKHIREAFGEFDDYGGGSEGWMA